MTISVGPAPYSQPQTTFTSIRAFSGASADSAGLPSSGDMVTVAGLPSRNGTPSIVEFLVENGGANPSTTGSPTSVILKIYRRVGGYITLIYTWVISQTDLTNSDLVPILVEGYASEYYVKLSFSGGASPTFTGTVRARAVE